MKHRINQLFVACILLILTSCQTVQTAYYSSLEKIGIEKRDVLVDRVEEARDTQTETKAVFASALAAFTDLTEFDGGDLETTYDTIKAAYKDSEDAAESVANRISKIESVAEALFAEWELELEAYSSETLRQKSAQSLRQTETNYNTMIGKMRKAEESMAPVLRLFKDQVLFLKHNLNARAIASLDTEVNSIQNQVTALVKEMEASIAEADAFIASMR